MSQRLLSKFKSIEKTVSEKEEEEEESNKVILSNQTNLQNN